MRDWFILAIVLIGVSGIGGLTLMNYLANHETVEDWFVLEALEIPDHAVGEDPIIVFERQIKRPLAGQWSVETQQRKPDGRFLTVCRGSGLSHYSPDESLPAEGVNLSWFRGACKALTGEHRLQVVWQFTDSSTGAIKSKIVETNTFMVKL